MYVGDVSLFDNKLFAGGNNRGVESSLFVDGNQSITNKLESGETWSSKDSAINKLYLSLYCYQVINIKFECSLLDSLV